MFIILLNFSTHRDQASAHLEGHKNWIDEGFDIGYFLVTGSQADGRGGAILAHNINREGLESFLRRDPFVAEDIVQPQIHEITPCHVAPEVEFLQA